MARLMDFYICQIKGDTLWRFDLLCSNSISIFAQVPDELSRALWGAAFHCHCGPLQRSWCVTWNIPREDLCFEFRDMYTALVKKKLGQKWQWTFEGISLHITFNLNFNGIGRTGAGIRELDLLCWEHTTVIAWIFGFNVSKTEVDTVWLWRSNILYPHTISILAQVPDGVLVWRFTSQGYCCPLQMNGCVRWNIASVDICFCQQYKGKSVAISQKSA